MHAVDADGARAPVRRRCAARPSCSSRVAYLAVGAVFGAIDVVVVGVRRGGGRARVRRRRAGRLRRRQPGRGAGLRRRPPARHAGRAVRRLRGRSSALAAQLLCAVGSLLSLVAVGLPRRAGHRAGARVGHRRWSSPGCRGRRSPSRWPGRSPASRSASPPARRSRARPSTPGARRRRSPSRRCAAALAGLLALAGAPLLRGPVRRPAVRRTEARGLSGRPRGSRLVVGRRAPRAAPPRSEGRTLWRLAPAVPTITLNNGVEIPQLGFGVFQIPPEETAEATRTALEIGYRHIDTAQMYGNEKGSARPSASSGIDRGEVFVTSKLNNNRLDRDDVLRVVRPEPRRPRLRPPRPVPHPLAAAGRRRDYVADAGRRWRRSTPAAGCKAIGVSNFQPHHLRTLFAASEVRPAVNQIEVHPFLAQDELRAFDAEHEIVTEAWSPIARGKVADDPVDPRDRRAARPHAGAGDAALARPARRRRLPEVGHPQPDRGELRRSSTSSSTSADMAAITGAGPGRAHRPRPRTSSTTSRGLPSGLPERRGLHGMRPRARSPAPPRRPGPPRGPGRRACVGGAARTLLRRVGPAGRR